MKRPIEKINDVFGYRADVGKVIHCNTILNDVDPFSDKNMRCFAEFAYEGTSSPDAGDGEDFFALDKVINVMLQRAPFGGDVFDFDKAKDGENVVCLFCCKLIGQVWDSLDLTPKTIELNSFINIKLPARKEYHLHMSNVELVHKKIFNEKEYSRLIFGGKQRCMFPVDYQVPIIFR